MENVSSIIPSNEMDLQLDFVFTSVYIGKIKGASKGCVTVSIFNFFSFLVLVLDKAFLDCLLFFLVQMKIELKLTLYRTFYICHYIYFETSLIGGKS